MTNALDTIIVSDLNKVIGGRGGFAAPRPAPHVTVINRTTTVTAPAAGGGFMSNVLSTAAGSAAGVAIGNYLSRPAAPAAAAPAATAPAPAAATPAK